MMPTGVCWFALACYLAAGHDDCQENGECVDAAIERGPSLLSTRSKTQFPQSWDDFKTFEGCTYLQNIQSDVETKLAEFQGFPGKVDTDINKFTTKIFKTFNYYHKMVQENIEKLTGLVDSKTTTGTPTEEQTEGGFTFNATQKPEKPPELELPWPEPGEEPSFGPLPPIPPHLELLQVRFDWEGTLRNIAKTTLVTFADKYKKALDDYIGSMLDKATERIRALIRIPCEAVLEMVNDVRKLLDRAPGEPDSKNNIASKLDQIKGNIQKIMNFHETINKGFQDRMDLMLKEKISTLSLSQQHNSGLWFDDVLDAGKDLAKDAGNVAVAAAAKSACEKLQNDIQSVSNDIISQAQSILDTGDEALAWLKKELTTYQNQINSLVWGLMGPVHEITNLVK